jgi:hypothetical protein
VGPNSFRDFDANPLQKKNVFNKPPTICVKEAEAEFTTISSSGTRPIIADVRNTGLRH